MREAKAAVASMNGTEPTPPDPTTGTTATVSDPAALTTTAAGYYESLMSEKHSDPEARDILLKEISSKPLSESSVEAPWKGSSG